MRHYRWQLRPPGASLAGGGQPAPNPHLDTRDFSALLSQLLRQRGHTDPSLWHSFLMAGPDQRHHPSLLPDLERAVARLRQALRRGEAIAVYGDFDVDGVAGTAILAQGLAELGARVIPYIPHRIEEGYGLNLPALEQLASQGAKVVVTVDCGLSAPAEAEGAAALGLDLIITDHHTLPPDLPPAVALVCPNRGDYPNPFLSGAGVAYQLLRGLYEAEGRPLTEERFLDLVALGTVADLSPLTGENRSLVKRGLEVMGLGRRTGLVALARGAGLEEGPVTAEAVSFYLGPRLNASGRLEHAIMSYELLTTASPQRSEELAQRLEALNRERQRLTEATFARARGNLGAAGEYLVFAADPAYPQGVAGIVASRLAEEFYRPALVLEVGPSVSRGSARSIPEFDLIAALRQCAPLLERFGGHRLAAGFTIANVNLGAFQQQLGGLAAGQLSGLDLRPALELDLALPPSALVGDAYRELLRLAPFGEGNPPPTFLAPGLTVRESRTMGRDGAHLRLKLGEGRTVWDAVGFGLGPDVPAAGARLDVAYRLGTDRWQGQEVLRLELLDFRPVGTEPLPLP
ncbi:MAG: single-stranded-DNA-specific exonuclease RecJ [Chloroflexi bacterium]|nr:single-stranded-DNA-specific exonuclease RecJ [Chloroflexota bacterium]